MTVNVCYANDLSTKCWLVGVVLLVLITRENLAQYVPPTPTVEPLQPKGLRMYIPHEDGISLVAYHVKFNNDFEGLEAGTIARDIIKTKNGRWTYEDRTSRIKPGDTIYYWMHVVYDGLGYNLVDKSYKVKEFYNYDGSLVAAAITPDGQPCSVLSETKIIERNGNRRNTCPGQLIFEDNFNELNTTRWTSIERFSHAPDFEFVVYQNSNENVEVKDSGLHIKPVPLENIRGDGFVRNGNLTLSRCTGAASTADCQREAFGSYVLPPVTSGRLHTKGSFSFLYGRIQVRAKLPKGDWIYPLISLEPVDEGSEHAVTKSEIRIASASGNAKLTTFDGNDLSGKVLSAGGLAIIRKENQVPHSNQHSLPTKVSNGLWSDEYHIYELEWRRGQITAKVDGELYGQQSVPLPFDTPFYLNLGVAVGGHVQFPDQCISGNYDKPWRNVESKALFKFYLARDKWLGTWRNTDTALHVDYVKIWAI